MIMLEQSWSALPNITIVNCFRKVGISRQSLQDSIQDTDDPFAQLAEILDELRVLGHEQVPDDLTSESLIAKDEEVATSIQHVLCDKNGCIRSRPRMLKSLMRRMMKWNQRRKSHLARQRYSRQST